MSVFIGNKSKRVELAERKDAINPNLFTGSKDFTGNWLNLSQAKQKDKYLDLTAVYVDWPWNGISQYIDVKKDEVLTVSAYIKAKAGYSPSWFTLLNGDTEDGHTKADANPSTQGITATGDWQKTSFTFTVTSDGTIKPRMESDGTTPFWFAGMKLEHGAVATDWCPALEDYAWTSDITNLQNTVNSKVNVDGPLYREIKNSSTWNDIFGVTNPNNVLTSLRIDPGGSGPLIGDCAAGIGFGGDDTKGVLSVDYEGNLARITAGNGDKPSWSEDIAWKSDITNLQSMVTGLSTKVDSITTKLSDGTLVQVAHFEASDEQKAVDWSKDDGKGGLPKFSMIDY